MWNNAEASTVPGSSRTSATAVDSYSECPPHIRSTFQRLFLLFLDDCFVQGDVLESRK
jgi:hypothetical protein